MPRGIAIAALVLLHLLLCAAAAQAATTEHRSLLDDERHCLEAAAAAAEDGDADAAGESSIPDVTWLLRSSFLILTMQAGFGMLESGLVREGNSLNVMVKNVVDIAFGGLAFWAIGYGLAYGPDSSSGFAGSGYFFLLGLGINEEAQFLFQFSFAATAATIVSGAMAERTKLTAYGFFSFIMTAVVYPIVAHWVWDERGFLFEMGFHDFAGCSVVHMVGGFAGLVGTIIVGPRKGRFPPKAREVASMEPRQLDRMQPRQQQQQQQQQQDAADPNRQLHTAVESFISVMHATQQHRDNTITLAEWTTRAVGLMDSLFSMVNPATSSAFGASFANSSSSNNNNNNEASSHAKPAGFRNANPVSAILGLFILWWGWFGFNTGSTLGTTGCRHLLAAHIALNTIISSVSGSSVAILYSHFKRGHIDVEIVINGTLAGLVGITAGCAVVDSWAAFIIGVMSPLFVIQGDMFLQRLRVDDPVSAVAVHGIGGFWGLVAVGLFGRPDAIVGFDSHGIFYGGIDGLHFLGVQIAGGLIILVWSIATSLMLCLPIDRFFGFRVENCDLVTLDESEHGIVPPVHFSNLSQFLEKRRESSISLSVVAALPRNAVSLGSVPEDEEAAAEELRNRASSSAQLQQQQQQQQQQQRDVSVVVLPS